MSLFLIKRKQNPVADNLILDNRQDAGSVKIYTAMGQLVSDGMLSVGHLPAFITSDATTFIQKNTSIETLLSLMVLSLCIF
ncbi:MAG: hypothetical protein AB8G86_07275 [Saprospiraceae bacterium]